MGNEIRESPAGGSLTLGGTLASATRPDASFSAETLLMSLTLVWFHTQRIANSFLFEENKVDERRMGSFD